MAARHRRRRSLRLRITAGALVVVVAALSGAGLVLIYAVQREMVAQIDSTLTANADFIDRSMRSGEGLPIRTGPTDLYVQFVGAGRSGGGLEHLGAGVAGSGPSAQRRPASDRGHALAGAW